MEDYIAFHKLSNFQLNYNRYIEKQVVIIEGINSLEHNINDKKKSHAAHKKIF